METGNTQKIRVQTASAGYDVLLGEGLLSSLARYISAKTEHGKRKIFVLTSPEIWALWSKSFLASFADNAPMPLFLPPGEEHKRLSTVERLCEELARAGADRGSLLIAFGGGVVGDVGGFVAAIYMRGIDYIQVPTTLLAQVDSSLGGKTGVNLAVGKNLVGSFHHPLLVIADGAVLSTLTDAELRAGLFECLKAGLIHNRELFAFIEERREQILARDSVALRRVIGDSLRMKAEVVAVDERESGLRMILNFGHTVGHAIEAATGYKALLHGEAVGWGMLAALAISGSRGLLSAEESHRAGTVIRAYGLPALPEFDAQQLLALTAGDKKNRSGVRRFVLLRSIGEACVVDDVGDAELLAALESCAMVRA